MMFVRKSTMDQAVEQERQRAAAERQAVYKRYGDALEQVSALAFQLSAWVTNKADNITPEQAGAMFYAQDEHWQAAFFNSMQAQVLAHHAANPSPYAFAGVPAGEGQWYHAMKHLTNDGFETVQAMFDHAAHHRRLGDAS